MRSRIRLRDSILSIIGGIAVFVAMYYLDLPIGDRTTVGMLAGIVAGTLIYTDYWAGRLELVTVGEKPPQNVTENEK